MSDLEIPPEAYRIAEEIYLTGKGDDPSGDIITATAPLIVAAELRGLARRISAYDPSGQLVRRAAVLDPEEEAP